MNAIFRALASATVLLPQRRCLPWRHTWELLLTDQPTCMRCHARAMPKDPFDVFEE